MLKTRQFTGTRTIGFGRLVLPGRLDDIDPVSSSMSDTISSSNNKL
jgi:hypothetical protein